MTIRSAGFTAIGVSGFALLVGGLVLSRGAGASHDDLSQLALGLAIVVTAALIGGHVAARLGQPPVLGELLAGVLLGNLPFFGALRFISTDPYLSVLSGVGMVLLMFEVGLGLSVRDLFAVGASSLLVAVVGSTASLAVGTATAALLLRSGSLTTHIFVGAAITATSVGITARVLKDMGAQRSREARVILGAAVVDDVLALVMLGVVTAMLAPTAAGAALSSTAVVALMMKTGGFLVLAILLGVKLTPTWFHQAARLQTQGALLSAGLCFCFVLAWAAGAIGLAPLVGAFAAGLVLEDAHSAVFVERGERPLDELLQPMTAFLVPVFFVLVGFRADVRALLQPSILLLPVALTVAAIVGKLSAAVGVVHRDVDRLTVACGMIPRGEVALVFAAVGGALMVNGAPVLDQRGYTAIVAVVILTTLLTPPTLKRMIRRQSGAGQVTRPAA